MRRALIALGVADVFYRVCVRPSVRRSLGIES
jgi:hypothetical protein